ncbi:glyoxalase [Bacillus amyloliquefaciens]|nr:glyoxalase [Bacillus amyloliquefaciens]
MKKCEGFVRPENERRETFFTLFRQTFASREKSPSVSFWLFIRQAHFVPIFLHKKLKKHRSFQERCIRD